MEDKNILTASCIDFYGSEGFEIALQIAGKTPVKVLPETGFVNHWGLLSPQTAKFPDTLKDKKRLLKPLRKINETFIEISFEEAFSLIAGAIKSVDFHETAFFAGARLSNEMLYSIQKLARTVFRSNNIGSFHYFNRNEGWYNLDKNDNLQLDELEGCGMIIVFGNGVEKANPLISALIRKIKEEKNIPVLSISTSKKDGNFYDKQLVIKDYYHFAKALNHHLLSHHLERGIFIEALPEPFERYKELVLQENYDEALDKAGVSDEELSRFLPAFLSERHAAIVFSECDISENCARELLNLYLLSGKNGIPYSGILDLKEKNNAQGLFDMGMNSRFGVGSRPFDASFTERLCAVWNFNDIQTAPIDVENALLSGRSRNVFILGEDPIGCAKNSAARKILENAQFLVVQDYFLTETAQLADVVLPDAFPFESGGSFTNTTKILRQFSKIIEPPMKYDALQQWAEIGKRFDMAIETSPDMIFLEFAQFLPAGCSGGGRHQFVYSKNDSPKTPFKAGCDVLSLESNKRPSQDSL